MLLLRLRLNPQLQPQRLLPLTPPLLRLPSRRETRVAVLPAAEGAAKGNDYSRHLPLPILR